MREIKFRAKGVDGEWWYGSLSPSKTLRHINLATFFTNLHTGVLLPETLSQYTSLKDKNGKEIYENDIIQFKYANYKKLRRAEIKWGTGGFWVVGWFRKIQDYDEFEVIGNIYENPRLLEKK